MQLKRAVWAGLASVMFLGCAPDEALDGAEAEAEEAQVSGPGFVYLRLRQDTRRCVSPLCGGVFVSRVNYRTMRCADGVYRGECYAATVDTTALTDEAASVARDQGVVLRGRIEAQTYEGFGNLGRVVVTEAWRPGAPDRTSALQIERVRDTGLRCVRAPCPSFEAVVLNRTQRDTLTGVNLVSIGADRATLALAQESLGAAGPGVLVAGHRALRGREEETLVAEQFWVRVGGTVADAQFCNTDDECTRTQYGVQYTSRSACACPSLCPVNVLNTTAAEENARYFNRYCASLRNSCPVARCAAPPSVACRQHVCVNAPLE
ncbi:MAG: hypothetical protein JNK72_16175 [Myxococcales bacterium]|nr:hypothetical protein [Myxococcales bacterium]